MEKELKKFINSIDVKVYNKIQNAKSLAESRRYLLYYLEEYLNKNENNEMDAQDLYDKNNMNPLDTFLYD